MSEQRRRVQIATLATLLRNVLDRALDPAMSEQRRRVQIATLATLLRNVLDRALDPACASPEGAATRESHRPTVATGRRALLPAPKLHDGAKVRLRRNFLPIAQ